MTHDFVGWDPLPLVSCLMPTKNRRRFLPRAFAMWAAQDWPNKELIVLEDGEQAKGDVAREALLDLLEQYPNVLYRYVKGTLGAKLNAAAKLARGSILINWDDDDWNAPTRISDQVAHMRLARTPVVGMSSLLYYAEGQEHGYEYTGNAWYASGSTHCYAREYVLAHPRPDKTVGEDNDWIEEARRLGAVSNLSGLRSLIACDHPNNCSSRLFGTELYQLMRDTADNWRKIPLAEFAATVQAS